MVAYGDDGAVDGHRREGRARRHRATTSPPSSDAVVGLYCYPPDVFEMIERLEPSSRGELEITDVNRVYAEQGRLSVRARRRLVARRRQALGRPRRGRPADRGDRRQQVIDGLRRIELRRFDDERGWFIELMRASTLPKPVRQANLARSRRGVIRALHYHERGQDDLFLCLQGMARVVVLDRESGETFTEDIGDENPVAIYVPGAERARLRGAHRLSLLLLRHRGVRRRRSGRARRARGTIPASSTSGAHDRRSCRTGTARPRPDHGRRRPARLRARARSSPEARALTRADWDVTHPPPAVSTAAGLVLHAAAWTDVDGAERRSPGRRRGQRRRRRRTPRRSVRRSSTWSTDYVFDGTKTTPVPRVGRAGAARRLRPDEAARRGGGGGAGVGHPDVVAVRLDVEELRPHDAASRRGARRGVGRRRPASAARPTRDTSPRRRGRCSSCRTARTTSRRRATAPGPSSRRRSSRRRVSTRACARITTAEFGARAPRPRVLGAAQRGGGAGAAALAGGPARVPGTPGRRLACARCGFSSPAAPASSARSSPAVWLPAATPSSCSTS